MTKSKEIPFSRMQKISPSGVFLKHFVQYGKTEMRPYAHRDDYYVVALLTDGSVAVEVDFERIELTAGDVLIVSPWQVHRRPAGEQWQADGWMLAFSPEFLSDADARALEEYSLSPRPLRPGREAVDDIVTLCAMFERNSGDEAVSGALALAIKSIVVSAIGESDSGVKDRYVAITLRFRELIEAHLAMDKSPSAYASMMNISEVYLNEAVRKTTGLSAGAYLRSRVIVQAKRQLAYTSMSAKEIAYSLGYGDYAYFSRLFRKSVGVSPSEYAKNLK